jgi:hypothetical protein
VELMLFAEDREVTEMEEMDVDNWGSSNKGLTA